MHTLNDYTNTALIEPIKKYAFVFVCQQGQLEIEAVLLAASLRRFLKCDYELIAMVPQPESVMGKPSSITLGLLKKMNVRIEYFNNEMVSALVADQPDLDFALPKNSTYLYANKLYCLLAKTDADKLIFLDSDMLLYEEFAGDICFSIPFNARLDGYLGSSQLDGKWAELFSLVGATLPMLRFTFKNKNDSSLYNFVPPCFNAGFVGINTDLAGAFFQIWLETYKKILARNFLEDPYYSEQIALTMAVHKMQIPYNILNGWSQPCPFFHYFLMARLKNNEKMVDLVKSFLNEYPEIKTLIKDKQKWAFLA